MTNRDQVFWDQNKVFIERMLGNLFAHPENEYSSTKSDLLKEFADTVSPEKSIEFEKFLLAKDLIDKRTYSVQNPTWALSRNGISILKSHGTYGAYLDHVKGIGLNEWWYRWKSIWIPTVAGVIGIGVSVLLAVLDQRQENTNNDLRKQLEERRTETLLSASKIDSLYRLLERQEQKTEELNESFRTLSDSMQTRINTLEARVRRK